MRKSPKVYGSFEPDDTLARDLEEMLDEVVRAGGSTQALLSVEHRLGDPLRARYPGGPPVKGVLMHPAVLAVHGGFEHSNPVGRGLFVLTNLLCTPPPPPPPGIARVPSETSSGETTRRKFARHSGGSCQGCHKAIDGIGFGFEDFDGAGQYRTEENGHRVDATGLLPIDGVDIPFNGVAELTGHLAASQQVANCFAKHVVRFALGAGERTEDAPLYDSLSRASVATTTYEERIRRIVASDSFITRRAP